MGSSTISNDYSDLAFLVTLGKLPGAEALIGSVEATAEVTVAATELAEAAEALAVIEEGIVTVARVTAGSLAAPLIGLFAAGDSSDTPIRIGIERAGKSIEHVIDEMQRQALLRAEMLAIEAQLLQLKNQPDLLGREFEVLYLEEQLLAVGAQLHAISASNPIMGGALKMVASAGSTTTLSSGAVIDSDIARRLKSDDIQTQWLAWKELYGHDPVAAKQVAVNDMGPPSPIVAGLFGKGPYVRSVGDIRDQVDSLLGGAWAPTTVDLRTVHPSHSLAEFIPTSIPSLVWTNTGWGIIDRRSYRTEYVNRLNTLLDQMGTSDPQKVLQTFMKESVKNKTDQTLLVVQLPSGKQVVWDGHNRSTALVQVVRNRKLDPEVWLSHVPAERWVIDSDSPIPEHLILRFMTPAHELTIDELLPPPPMSPEEQAIRRQLKDPEISLQENAWRLLYILYPTAAQKITPADMGPPTPIGVGNGVKQFVPSSPKQVVNSVMACLRSYYGSYPWMISSADLRTIHPSHSLAEFSFNQTFDRRSYRTDYVRLLNTLLDQMGTSDPQKVLQAFMKKSVHGKQNQALLVIQLPSGKQVIGDGHNHSAALMQVVRDRKLDPEVWLSRVPAERWYIDAKSPIPEHLILRFLAPAHELRVEDLIPSS